MAKTATQTPSQHTQNYTPGNDNAPVGNPIFKTNSPIT